LCYGGFGFHNLWNPNPPKTIYIYVSIGDVGYVRDGVFIRMFNVILPWEDLILVSGCTLVPSFAASAFMYNTVEAKISLARRTLSNGGECLTWGNIRDS
jgi:hypothetical protein